MKKLEFIVCGALLAGSMTAFAALQGPQQSADGQSGSPVATSASARSKIASDEASEGEKRFHQHCGRCHVAPSSVSPRIAGTVLRHMRVRASLSKEDEQYILKYIAP